MKRPLVQLRRDEQILAFVRRSLIAVAPGFLVRTVFFLFPFFFFFPLLRYGSFGLGIAVTLMAVGAFLNIAYWHRWNRTVLIVTNERVIDLDQVGIWKNDISEITYDQITDASVRQTRLGKLLDYGHVRLSTSKSFSYDIDIYSIRRPHAVANLVLDLKSMQYESLEIHKAERV